MIREARNERKFTAQELADRAGISRGLLQRIEKGNLKCEIGAVFEVATIVGIKLFEADGGALTKQLRHTNVNNVSMEKLIASAERVEQGIPLIPELDQALFHGSSIGGARPKAIVEEGGKKYVAKFSSSTDLYSVVKAEYIAMRLAELAGLDVAPVALEKAAPRPTLKEMFSRLVFNILSQETPMITHGTMRPSGMALR